MLSCMLRERWWFWWWWWRLDNVRHRGLLRDLIYPPLPLFPSAVVQIVHVIYRLRG